MPDVFVSYAQDDAAVALTIVFELEQAGYKTWCYQFDSYPGPPYPQQINDAIRECTAVLLVISPTSLKSSQVTAEVIEAHERDRPFVPVLLGLTYEEFEQQSGKWPATIKMAGPIPVPAVRIGEIIPRITAGLQRLGIQSQGLETNARIASITRKLVQMQGDAPAPGQFKPRRSRPRKWVAVATLLGVMLAVAMWMFQPEPSNSQLPAGRVSLRIAVMDFENRHLERDPSHDWMCQGLRDDFVTELNEIAELEVFADPEVRLLGEGHRDRVKAARKAGMAKLIDGAFAVERERINIWANVKDVGTGKIIAAVSRGGTLNTIDNIRSEIVVELLDRLELRLPEDERKLFRRQGLGSLAARKLLIDAERSGGTASASQPTPTVAAVPEVSSGRSVWQAGYFASVARAAEDDGSQTLLRAELRALLEGYRGALERKDINALSRYYAEFTDAQKAALSTYFEGADELQVRFGEERITVMGARATISYKRIDDFVDRTTRQPQQVVVRQTKVFARGPTGWQIVPNP